MEPINTIALMMGSAWASGINLYATILVLGWMGSTGQVDLPASLHVLTDPSVMIAAGLMYVVEFFADKTPGVDTGWDTIHTFIRIPAGAMLAAGASQGLHMGEAGQLVALILGGGLATASHATKAGTRVLINTSPEPFSNWAASITEDIAVIGGMWTALHHPWLFLIALVLFIALVIWLLPRIWRAIKAVFRKLRSWFGGSRDRPDASRAADTSTATATPDALGELFHDAKSGKNKN